MMAAMGMLPMVAMLVGSESAAAGFIVHMVISVIIGALFAAFLGGHVTSTGSAIGWGLIYGVIWWVLGPLIIMPIWLGMGHQLSAAGAAAAIPSLWGHFIFGFILGAVYFLFVPHAQAEVPQTGTPA